MPIFTTLGAACAKAWGFTSGLITDQYFNLVSLLLPGNGTNGAQNNTFQDSSPNSFPITRNPTSGPNAPTQGTFSPFSQTGWGNYFDGTGDYLGVGSDAAFAYGTSDFTWEVWVFPTSSTWTSGSGNFYIIDHGSSNGTLFYYQNRIAYYNLTTGTGSALYTGGGTVTPNQWSHIAVSRQSGTTRIYVNGQLSTSGSDSNNYAAQAVTIGKNGGGAQEYVGYMSNVRIVKGTAVYTSNFTPPTSPLTAISGTSLLTCQSNRFIDNSSSPKTITPAGNVAVTPFSPFAPTQSYSAAAVGGSGYFDGTGDYLEIGTTSSFNFLHNTTATFTIQGWIYPLALPGSGSLSTLFATATGSQDVGMGVYLNYSSSSVATLQLFIARGVSGSLVIDAGSSALIRANTWQHVAVTYDYSLGSDNAKFYINGVAAGTATKNANTPSSSNATYVGNFGRLPNSALYNFNGYTSNFRIDNSVQSISLPTSPLGTISGTQLLLNFTNAGVVDATAKNVLETVGNAQISTTQSKWGGGSMYFNGSSSYLMGAANQQYEFGSGDFTVECWVNISAAANYGGIISKGPVGAINNTTWTLEFNGSGNTVSWLVYAASTSYIINGTSNIKTSSWIHLAVTRSGNNTRLFVNGTQEGSTYTGSYTIATGNNLYIGGGFYSPTTNTITGYVDDVRLTKFARYVEGTGGNAGKMVFNGTNTLALPTAPFPVQ